MQKTECIHTVYKAPLFYVFLVVTCLLPGIGAFGEEDPAVVADASYFGKTIREIEYAADLPVDRVRYDPYVGIRPGDELTRTALKSAIQSLYDSGRFSSIAVEALSDGDGVRLRFVLRYNYYFNNFILQGDFDLKGRSLWEWVPLPVGKRFTSESLRKAREDVLKFIKDRGYYLAEIQTQTDWDDDTRQVNVVFTVQPGDLAVIRSIQINNVPESDTGKLLDIFGFKTGKRFDKSRLTDRMENLRKHFVDEGYFAVVAEVSEFHDSETNQVDLIILVYNYKKVRVLLEGFKIDKTRLHRLLSVLAEAEENTRDEALKRGVHNIEEFLAEKGYAEAQVGVSEEDQNGVDVLRFRIKPGRKSVIENVSFQACTVFPESEMLEAVRVRLSTLLKSTPFSVKLLDEGANALQLLYESQGYLAADIVYSYEEIENTRRFRVTFGCAEGPVSRVDSIEFTGNVALTDQDLIQKVDLTPGTAYSPSIVERSRQIILAAYNDAGYLHAKVNFSVEFINQSNAYRVEFQIDEGTQFLVDQIVVLGNRHTHRSVVDSRVKLKTGDPLSLGKLLETQQALYRLGIFDQVRVEQQNPESTSPYQNVVVRLRESKRFTIRYGLGYREEEKLRGTLEFSDLNVLGLAKRADLRLRGSSKEQQAVFNLRQTQFHPLPVDSYVSLSASYSREEFGRIRRLGASYQFSRPINDHSWAMLRYNFKNVHTNIYEIVGVSEEELRREDRSVNLSTFSVAYINDSRDNYLDPAVGFFSSSEFGVTTKLLGEKSYVSFFTQNSYFRKLPKSFMTAVSLRFGVLQPYDGSDVPISEKFFAGGASSLRGFDTDFAGPLGIKISDETSAFTPVGGNGLFIGSVELRRPVLSFIHLAGFYDTGNVFETIDNFNFSRFSHSIGAGLRIKTPLGPLRIDYGYNLNLPAHLQYPDPPLTGLERGHLFITVGPPF